MVTTELSMFFTIALSMFFHFIFCCLTTFLLWDALLLDHPFSLSLFYRPLGFYKHIQPISVGSLWSERYYLPQIIC